MPNELDIINDFFTGALKAAAPDPVEMGEKYEEHKAKKKAREDLHEMLARAAGRSARTSPVVRHGEPAKKISLPTAMPLSKAREILAREQEAEEKKHWLNFMMPYKFEDGLVATQAVLEDLYGASGEGITHFDFFGGEHPPEKLDVQVGLDGRGEPVTTTVPWTEFYFGPIDARIDFETWSEGQNSGLFMLKVYTKVELETDAQGIAAFVRHYLDTQSIYRGQILTFDPSGKYGYGLKQVDRKIDTTIVYSADVQRRLENKVRGKITQAEALNKAGKRTDFRVLLWGPLGTGKSAGMVSTAVLARANGRTVVEYRPTEKATINELQRVMAVARMYGPAVVLVEDFDRFFPLTKDNRSMLTNLLDGVDKDDSVSLLMTTNYLDRVDPSVLRTPRITGLIEIKHLDREGIEQLLHLTLGAKLAADIDFDRIWDVVHDYSPSFIRSAYDEAEAIAVQTAEANGRSADEIVITTDALIDAAMDLHDQHQKYEELTNAQAGEQPDYLRLGLRDLLSTDMFTEPLEKLIATQLGERVRSERANEVISKG